MAPVKVGRISYVNVDPIYYGLEHVWKPALLDIVSAPPSALNHRLACGELDISAVSSFAYARNHKDWLLLPDFCIACLKDVMSVLLVSRLPIHSLDGKKIYVTDESATAASLIRLVLKMQGTTPRYETGKIKRPEDIRTDDGAALVIGDTAMRGDWHLKFPHVWDLGDLWSELTGLPFVFAVWAVRKSFALAHPETVRYVLKLMRESRDIGLSRIGEVADAAASTLGVSRALCERYFKNFCYDLGKPQLKGLTTFFDRLHREGFLEAPVDLSFFAPG